MVETTSKEPLRLGEILIQRGKISKKQLTTALNYQFFERQRDSDCQVGEFLVNHRCINRDELEDALRAQGDTQSHRISSLEKTIRIFSVKDKELFEFVPKEIAINYCVFPIALKEDHVKKTLYMAVCDVSDKKMIDAIQFKLGCFVTPLPSTKKNIQKSIQTYYP